MRHSFLQDRRLQGATFDQVDVLESIDLRPHVGITVHIVVGQDHDWSLVPA